MSITVEVTGIVLHDGTVTVAEGVVRDATPDEYRGTTQLLGRHVTFAGDRRPMEAVEASLERGNETRVVVDRWQLLG